MKILIVLVFCVFLLSSIITVEAKRPPNELKDQCCVYENENGYINCGFLDESSCNSYNLVQGNRVLKWVQDKCTNLPECNGCCIEKGQIMTEFQCANQGLTWNPSIKIEEECKSIDSDGDGFTNYEEDFWKTDVYDPTHTPFDIDKDGIPDRIVIGSEYTIGKDDNCPIIYNPDQTDTDTDGVGDICDNCQSMKNPYIHSPTFPFFVQTDSDWDGVGDACDNCQEIMNGKPPEGCSINRELCDQADSDYSCRLVPTPYTEDPKCGDACQNDGTEGPVITGPEGGTEVPGYSRRGCDFGGKVYNEGDVKKAQYSGESCCEICVGNPVTLWKQLNISKCVNKPANFVEIQDASLGLGSNEKLTEYCTGEPVWISMVKAESLCSNTEFLFNEEAGNTPGACYRCYSESEKTYGWKVAEDPEDIARCKQTAFALPKGQEFAFVFSIVLNPVILISALFDPTVLSLQLSYFVTITSAPVDAIKIPEKEPTIEGDKTVKDLDKDGVSDAEDNCKNIQNPNQKDSDTDGIGDLCDSMNNNKVEGGLVIDGEEPLLDTDNDGVQDSEDSCPFVYNPEQQNVCQLAEEENSENIAINTLA